MEQSLKRRIAGGAAGLALLAGAGGAAFADSSGSPRDDRDAFLNGVAKRLNVSPDKLREAMEQEAQEHGGPPPPPPGAPGAHGYGFRGGPPPLAGPPPPGRPPFPGHPPGPPPPIMAGLDAAAKYLGLTDAQLRTRLESGKSLADVAKERNKSVDGLKSAIEAAVTSELHSHIDDLVNGKLRGRHRHW
jgi:hypothetical protein